MTIKELIKELKKLDQKSKIVIASDEELNNIYKDIEINPHYISDYIVMFGLSDSRLSECYGCDRLFGEDDLIASVWDNHSYCEKCLADLNAEYKAHGYTYDEDTGIAKDNEGNIIND